MGMNVQISKELFDQIYEYFFCYAQQDERTNDIIFKLNDKVDKMISHEYFTKYKKSLTSEEREFYRKKYLESVNMNKNFISDKEIHL